MLPQDVLLMMKLAFSCPPRWTYNAVAYELEMSPSMAHAGIKRASVAGLYDALERRPVRKALEEFLVHGVKYAFPAEIGTPTRGVPTGAASPVLREHFSLGDEVHVWPLAEGTVRGISLSPLYKSVPRVALKDDALYEALGALDAIRAGRVRERKMAKDILVGLLRDHG